MRAALLEVETGLRGFALAGTPEFLEPYDTGRRAVGVALAEVRTLTADHPGQPRLVAELETLVQARLALAAQVVQARRDGGVPAAEKLVAAGGGRGAMEAARRVLAQLREEERQLRIRRDADSQRAAHQALGLALAARVTAIALFVLAFRSYRREHRRRTAAEAGGLESNAQLEQRVHQRTAELVRSNQSLAAAQARLSLIINTEPECVKIVSPAGCLLEMNAAGLAMIEADSLAQVRDQPLSQLIAPAHREAFRDLHARVLAGGTGSLAFEAVGLRGARRWLETHAVPLREGGRVTALLGITRDITERKQAEAIVVCQTTVLELIGPGRAAGRDAHHDAPAPGSLCAGDALLRAVAGCGRPARAAWRGAESAGRVQPRH